mmetsp:Transcript_49135/g.106941  ORF Transcript_49135/g.106941 Transcript_49135/m.106941 type:complete len:200 (-) Transcript_49135:423-1022(-)
MRTPKDRSMPMTVPTEMHKALPPMNSEALSSWKTASFSMPRRGRAIALRSGMDLLRPPGEAAKAAAACASFSATSVLASMASWLNTCRNSTTSAWDTCASFMAFNSRRMTVIWPWDAMARSKCNTTGKAMEAELLPSWRAAPDAVAEALASSSMCRIASLSCKVFIGTPRVCSKHTSPPRSMFSADPDNNCSWKSFRIK